MQHDEATGLWRHFGNIRVAMENIAVGIGLGIGIGIAISIATGLRHRRP